MREAGEIIREGEGRSKGEGETKIAVKTSGPASIEESTEVRAKAASGAPAHASFAQSDCESVDIDVPIENIFLRGIPRSPRLEWLAQEIRDLAAKKSFPAPGGHHR